MSKTIEAARAELERTFEEMTRVANAMSAVDLLEDIQRARISAGVDLAPVMCEYYTTARIGFADFARAVITAGIDQTIIILGKRLADTLCVMPRSKFTAKTLYDYTEIINRAREFSFVAPRETIQYDQCECGRSMNKIEATYLVCECGLTKVSTDIPTKEEINSRDDVIKRPKANYTYGRHYDYWSSRIQGIEGKDIPVEWLKKIQRVLVRDKYKSTDLNCEVIRSVLKDPAVQLTTELNEHASFLVGKFGGTKPYILTADESHRAKEMFLKIMYFYEKQHPNAGNKPYYPYFIYKIYEHMFAADRTKLKVLGFIHLQSTETVRKHDNDLAEICKEAGAGLELSYRPTDRSRR